jgi:hypothetical protein
MSKTIQEIREWIAKQEGGNEYEGEIVNLIEAEKTNGIKSRNEANKEAKALRERMQVAEQKLTKYNEAIKKLGYDPEDDSQDIDSFIDTTAELVSKVRSGKDTPDDVLKNSPLVKDLQKQFKKLEKEYQTTSEQLKAEREAANILKQKQAHNTIRTKISKALTDDSGKSIMLGTDLLIENLIHSNKVTLKDDNDTVVFVNGDEELDFSEGLAKLKNDRKDLLVNTQRSGSGSGDSGGKGTTGPESDADRLKRLRAMKNNLAL